MGIHIPLEDPLDGSAVIGDAIYRDRGVGGAEAYEAGCIGVRGDAGFVSDTAIEPCGPDRVLEAQGRGVHEVDVLGVEVHRPRADLCCLRTRAEGNACPFGGTAEDIDACG